MPEKSKKLEWEKRFDEKFLGYISPNAIVGKYNIDKEIKSFIKSLLSQQEAELIKEFTEGKRCLNCGNHKPQSKLIDLCDKCYENE